MCERVRFYVCSRKFILLLFIFVKPTFTFRNFGSGVLTEGDARVVRTQQERLFQNASEKYSITFANFYWDLGLVIDLKPEFYEFGAANSNGISTSQVNKSALYFNQNESVVRSSDRPRHICIQPKNGEEKRVESVFYCEKRPSLIGIRVSGGKGSHSEGEVIEIPTDTKISVIFFGADFSIGTEIAFTNHGQRKNERCDTVPLIRFVKLSKENIISNKVVKFTVTLPPTSDTMYYVCLKDSGEKIPRWLHQGTDSLVSMKPIVRMIPLELQLVIIGVLLVLSGLFSGLNLGLMALECTELKLLQKCGTEAEKKYAKKIYPIRKRSNYLLCSLLLGNVLVNNTLTILLDDLTSGMIAVILSTFCIVIFGEIIPQAICSRHGLAVGAKTLCITKLFMIITFPLSFPISKLLDLILGAEIRNVYNRKRLMEFIRLTKDYNDLHHEEVEIISGALELTRKTVTDVMTRINDVFMVPINSVLNFETVSEIMKQGYSRIPVYEGDRSNIVALMNIKDLAFVDPDTDTQMKTLCEFYNHPVNFVFEDTTLDVMLNEFKKGRSHLSFVRRVNNEEDGDPFYELLGIVTLEDVIEEIIQSEIVDETDVLTDNRRKRVREEPQNRQDFSEFARLAAGDKKSTIVSPQLTLATYQYLSTAVEPFKALSETILKKLLSQDVFYKTRALKDGDKSAKNILMQNGKSVDYFILILEGRTLVTTSRENMVFECGPFHIFGLPALSQNIPKSTSSSSVNSPDNPPIKAFIPDYTVVAVGEVLYMKVHSAVYLSAYRATQLEKQQRTDGDKSGFLSRCSSKDIEEYSV